MPNQLKFEGLTWKKISITQNDPKQKITIKKIGIKIEKQNKFYFCLKCEIEKKN